MSAIFISMFEQNFLFLVAKRLFDVGRVWMSSASGITSDRAASIYLRHRRVLCHWRRVRTCPVTVIGVPTATTEGTSQPITDAELSIYVNEDKYWLDCSNIAIKSEILNIYIEDRRVQWEESNMMQFRQSSQVSTGFRRETFIKIICTKIEAFTEENKQMIANAFSFKTTKISFYHTKVSEIH